MGHLYVPPSGSITFRAQPPQAVCGEGEPCHFVSKVRAIDLPSPGDAVRRALSEHCKGTQKGTCQCYFSSFNEY